MKISSSKTLAIFYLQIAFLLTCNNFLHVDCKGVRVHTGKQRNRPEPRPHILRKKSNEAVTRKTLPVSGEPTPPAGTSHSRRTSNKEIMKKQEGNSFSRDPIQHSFDSGFQRLLKFFRGIVLSASGFIENEDFNNINFEAPMFLPPNFSLSKHFNVSNLIKLLNSPDDSEIEQLAESAIVDTISQLVGVVGFTDLRDWMILTLMSFVIGPILVPLIWLPISMFIMLALLTPQFIFNPPSATLGRGAEKRSFDNHIDYLNSNSVSDVYKNSKQSENTTEQPSPPSILGGCMERVTCQLAKLYRDNSISQWLTRFFLPFRRFNSTKVEWARYFQHFGNFENYSKLEAKMMLYTREDCKKYSCPIMYPFTP